MTRNALKIRQIQNRKWRFLPFVSMVCAKNQFIVNLKMTDIVGFNDGKKTKNGQKKLKKWSFFYYFFPDLGKKAFFSKIYNLGFKNDKNQKKTGKSAAPKRFIKEPCATSAHYESGVFIGLQGGWRFPAAPLLTCNALKLNKLRNAKMAHLTKRVDA